MCDPATAVALSVASAAASAGGGFITANRQAKAASRRADAANRNHLMVTQENRRLQNETNRIRTERKSDRVRQANAELGTIRAASGELGLGHTTPFVTEAAYNEGLDLSRIDTNADNQIQRIQASSKASHLSTLAEVQGAMSEAKAAKTGALLNALGSGLHIGADVARYKMRENRV